MVKDVGFMPCHVHALELFGVEVGLAPDMILLV